ncbi:MAPEG family protein [Aquamicrobium zhengzhouense]|uniref:MAPEG family protein n=1 Tax=Aquamicrobium zhengzhouense TaxID=2781738 RepID=A0ABS0SCZ1_9HYPH|nr:MAPEG family protein [Aquamicrobium zhengzhouense]MBI1621170.1 MAPEG family protein [Aquamicrobium zhengzhouense]
MEQTAIFWPMIAHFALVIGLYGLLGIRRKQAVEEGAVKISQFRENQDEPAQSLFVRNSLANQTELPPLFHIVCIALFVTQGVGLIALSLAWLFVLSRYVHAGIHVTSNRIRYRQPAFLIGFVSVVLLWGALAIHLM